MDSLETLELELDQQLQFLNEYFNFNRVISPEVNTANIRSYYSLCYFAYRLAHSPEGATHMAINWDKTYNTDGHHEHARIIKKTLMEHMSKDCAVLELGCGTGFNINLLATELNDVSFTGIDLTPKHVRVARSKAKKAGLKNTNFIEMSFSKLDFPEASFDVIYAIECFCHSLDYKHDLKDIFRMLKPGGHLIMFDGFRIPKEHSNEKWRLACELVEKAMAVREFHNLNEFRDALNLIGFNELKHDNLSEYVLPNMRRLRSGSNRFLKRKLLAKVLLAILPNQIGFNLIAGILMPLTMGAKLHQYSLIISHKADNA